MAEPAELVHAALIDDRVFDPENDAGPSGVYVPAVPARGLPFHLIRHWKAPQGLVHETIEIVGPDADVVHRIGPEVRRMVGMMDVTRLDDLVDDARFMQGGIHLASFKINGVLVSQIEFEVLLQVHAGKLPAEVEKGLKGTDVAWIGVIHEGRDVAAPSWFLYQNAKLYVLSDPDRKAGEQFVPGIPDSDEVVVITRREKGKDTALHRFMAAVRVIPASSPEFDSLAQPLADRRRSRHGSPAESIAKWKQGNCVIGELTPAV